MTAKISANDIATVIFLSLMGTVLICAAMFVFMMALFLGAWDYAALGMLGLGIPIFLLGFACILIAFKTARQRRVLTQNH